MPISKRVAHRQIQFGSILHHPDLPRPDGTLAGRHYCAVVSDAAEISAGVVFQVVGITTNPQPRPLPSGTFAIDVIPGRPGGDPTTGLSELSFVVCTWNATIPQSSIAPFHGKHVPLKVARDISAWFNAKDAEERAHAAAKANPPGGT